MYVKISKTKIRKVLSGTVVAMVVISGVGTSEDAGKMSKMICKEENVNKFCTVRCWKIHLKFVNLVRTECKEIIIGEDTETGVEAMSVITTSREVARIRGVKPQVARYD